MIPKFTTPSQEETKKPISEMTEIELIIRDWGISNVFGTVSDLRKNFGDPGPMAKYEEDPSKGPANKYGVFPPSDATQLRYAELEKVVKASYPNNRGCVWTVFEDEKGRTYVRNELRMWTYGESAKVIGWIVTPKGSGVFYQNYFLLKGESLW